HERELMAVAAEQLERVGLLDKAYTPALELSYGDQRRLEIARALAARPSVLVLDEPAAGMNRVEAAQLTRLIRELGSGGLAVLVIEHNVRMMLDTCDRIMVLNFGETIASGQPSEVARNEAVLEAYLGTDDTNGSGAHGADGDLTQTEHPDSAEESTWARFSAWTAFTSATGMYTQFAMSPLRSRQAV